MRRHVWLFIVAAVVAMIVGIGASIWVVRHRDVSASRATTPTGIFGYGADDRDNAREAAAVAADYPVHRAAAVHPTFDDTTAVPVYPPGTTVALDQASWVRVGDAAGAYALVQPPGQRVMIYFARLAGHWRITQIEAVP